MTDRGHGEPANPRQDRAQDLPGRYASVRQRTMDIVAPLETEDFVIQPMDDASPPKWHLAHVTWFFETFILKPFVPGYSPFDDAYEVLFNSYYNGVGAQFPRPRRGHLSRPTVREVMDYRAYVDQKMAGLLAGELSGEVRFRVVLGLNHEQQHQELMYTDLKYNLGNNPLYPPYRSDAPSTITSGYTPMAYCGMSRGIYEVGLDDPAPGFAFDNESPCHEVLIEDFEIADRLVTNGEYLAFMQDKGYERPELWLSDAWSVISGEGGFQQPLYWVQRDGDWYEYTLDGLRPLVLDAPVCHVSGYEADAFARWAGARLPSEQEWEVAAAGCEVGGNFIESDALHPMPAPAGDGPRQMFGDVWEWTSSSYGPYPGFRTFDGQLGEYNGKFMANQLVLRGGSCVTPVSHIRPSYRNFFYPPDRWQFSGIRLARTPV